MLTAIGFMVAAYAIYRILTDILRGPSRYPAVAFYALTIAFGVITMCIIGVCAADLLSSAASPTRP